MTSATADLAPQTSQPLERTTPAVPAATAEQRRAEAALRRAAEDAANAGAVRKQYAWGYAALVFGLVVSLATFGVIAYEGSTDARGASTSVSTTAP